MNHKTTHATAIPKTVTRCIDELDTFVHCLMIDSQLDPQRRSHLREIIPLVQDARSICIPSRSYASSAAHVRYSYMTEQCQGIMDLGRKLAAIPADLATHETIASIIREAQAICFQFPDDSSNLPEIQTPRTSNIERPTSNAEAHTSSFNVPCSMLDVRCSIAAYPPHDPNRSDTIDGFTQEDYTNGIRAQDAQNALRYPTSFREGSDYADLICNLLHLAHREGFDPQETYASALNNFHAEAAELPTT